MRIGLAKMIDEELKALARDVIYDYMTDIEYMSILEAAEEFYGRELSEDEGEKVADLVYKATVKISWDDD